MRACSRPLCYTLKLLAYKKRKKQRKKIPPQKNFVYLFSMQLFSAVAKMFSDFFFLFAHKKLKKPFIKVAHNRPKPFISQSSPAQPTAHSPELIFHIIKCREQASVLLSALDR
jgi:hypothetical protein